MLALLLAAGITYLLLGDKGEALILLLFACFSILLTVVQEARTENVLEALQDLSAPRALVVRDGGTVRVPGREVVVDDILVLDEGDRIAADALVLDALTDRFGIDLGHVAGRADVEARVHAVLDS